MMQSVECESRCSVLIPILQAGPDPTIGDYMSDAAFALNKVVPPAHCTL